MFCIRVINEESFWILGSIEEMLHSGMCCVAFWEGKVYRYINKVLPCMSLDYPVSLWWCFSNCFLLLLWSWRRAHIRISIFMELEAERYFRSCRSFVFPSFFSSLLYLLLLLAFLFFPEVHLIISLFWLYKHLEIILILTFTVKKVKEKWAIFFIFVFMFYLFFSLPYFGMFLITFHFHSLIAWEVFFLS